MESSGGKWWVTSRGKKVTSLAIFQKIHTKAKIDAEVYHDLLPPDPQKGLLFLRARRKRAHWDGKFQTTNRSLPNYFVSEWEGNKIKWHFWVQLANNFRLWPRPDKTRRLWFTCAPENCQCLTGLGLNKGTRTDSWPTARIVSSAGVGSGQKSRVVEHSRLCEVCGFCGRG